MSRSSTQGPRRSLRNTTSVAPDNNGDEKPCISASAPVSKSRKRALDRGDTAGDGRNNGCPSPSEHSQALTSGEEAALRAAQLLANEPSGQPSPKRARLRRSRSPDGQIARKHPDFWYLDGSAIIQINDTEFKLHRSTLARLSTYLRDLFAEKPEGHVSGQQDGTCPIYRVDGVNVLDFERLMTSIESGLTIASEAQTFGFIASVLRAATWLAFPAARTWAVQTLEDRWPPHLASFRYDRARIPNAEETLHLARTYDVPGVLKRALYELLRTQGFGLVHDPSADDADVPSDGEAEGAAPGNSHAAVSRGTPGSASLADDHNVPKPHTLQNEDIILLLHAREKLTTAWIVAVGTAPSDFACPSEGSRDIQCMGTKSSAGKRHKSWSTIVHASGIFEDGAYDPIAGIEKLFAVKWKREGYCVKCVAEREAAWKKLQQKWWDSLDIWFDL